MAEFADADNMATVKTNIIKLQQALNYKGERIVVDTHQFFSEQQQRPITMYTVAKSVPSGRSSENVKLFTSASQVHILYFLRDYWFYVNNLPIPQEDMEWNRVKERYGIKF